ncbi:CbiX/SirB N-terminal domain-containing protein [Nocardiopsis sp. NPDC006139]|uniref:Cobalamin biosynthesis protein CbiX n=1 Tax=Nocardiopsis changdeensis TaxID=2831969 RepID=A0ABX8BUX2_9ACTN|nr:MULTISPECIES: CbiX/SirB N-terminal domain-containing protein [Nocardiopsis]QUX24553.1 cobalamin biosynthesis protein CbiX [Nocardiopsis changdeensis]QYX34942.1 CbiX/SirB N-terminal domain-containing protein [Nocardiopsis sp. MT53]
MRNSDRLPPRELPKRRSGRHRNPLSFDDWFGTPTLIMAVPGTAERARGVDGESIGARMADLVRAYRPEVTIRHGHLEGDEETLAEALSGLQGDGERPLTGVVVPLVTAPHAGVSAAIDAAVRASGADVRVSEGLGPHPMLAEVLHLRLAESGYVRADRMRLISVVARDTGMADGVVVGAVGGEAAVAAAGVTAVLLAARLGLTVLPADLENEAALEQAIGQLRQGGCRRPVIAPSALGPELRADLSATAERFGARLGAPLGADGLLGKIAALRYAEILNSLGVEQPPTADQLPAPVGSRHRPEA